MQSVPSTPRPLKLVPVLPHTYHHYSPCRYAKEADRLKEQYRGRVIDRMVGEYGHHIEVMERAATHVQKHFRGRAAKRRVQKLRERRAAVSIQRAMRGYLGRRRVLDLLEHRYLWLLSSPTLAETGQRLLHPSCGLRRRRVKVLVELKRRAATYVQRVQRGLSDRRYVVRSMRATLEPLYWGRRYGPSKPKPRLGLC